jgi:hypothetical protein
VGQAQFTSFSLIDSFSKDFNWSSSKNIKCELLDVQTFPNFAGWQVNPKETTSSIDPTSKSLWILNYKIQEKIQFETYLNFKGVQTFEEKIYEFTKIIHWHDLQYWEFRLTHLYSKIWSSFTSAKWLKKEYSKRVQIWSSDLKFWRK